MKMWFAAAMLACATSFAGCAGPAPDAALPGAGDPFWAAGERTPEARFEQARRSTPELIAFLRRMPKGADLHNHMGGSADDLVQVYGAAEVPALATLSGHDVHGTWQLRVIDTWFLDEGEIRGWRLVANLAS